MGIHAYKDRQTCNSRPQRSNIRRLANTTAAGIAVHASSRKRACLSAGNALDRCRRRWECFRRARFAAAPDRNRVVLTPRHISRHGAGRFDVHDDALPSSRPAVHRAKPSVPVGRRNAFQVPGPQRHCPRRIEFPADGSARRCNTWSAAESVTPYAGRVHRQALRRLAHQRSSPEVTTCARSSGVCDRPRQARERQRPKECPPPCEIF